MTSESLNNLCQIHHHLVLVQFLLITMSLRQAPSPWSAGLFSTAIWIFTSTKSLLEWHLSFKAQWRVLGRSSSSKRSLICVNSSIHVKALEWIQHHRHHCLIRLKVVDSWNSFRHYWLSSSASYEIGTNSLSRKNFVPLTLRVWLPLHCSLWANLLTRAKYHFVSPILEGMPRIHYQECAQKRNPVDAKACDPDFVDATELGCIPVCWSVPQWPFGLSFFVSWDYYRDPLPWNMTTMCLHAHSVIDALKMKSLNWRGRNRSSIYRFTIVPREYARKHWQLPEPSTLFEFSMHAFLIGSRQS